MFGDPLWVDIPIELFYMKLDWLLVCNKVIGSSFIELFFFYYF